MDLAGDEAWDGETSELEPWDDDASMGITEICDAFELASKVELEVLSGSLREQEETHEAGQRAHVSLLLEKARAIVSLRLVVGAVASRRTLGPHQAACGAGGSG